MRRPNPAHPSLPLALRLPAPLALLILLLLAIVPLTWAISELEMSTSAEDFIPKDDPAFEFEQQLREHFPRNASLIAIFALDDTGLSDVFLDDLGQISETMAAHPLVSRLYSPTHSERLRGRDDQLRSERLLGPVERAGLTHAERLERLQSNPLVAGSLVAHDGSRVALVMQPGEHIGSAQRQVLHDAFEEALAESDITRERVSLTGTIAINLAQIDATIQDVWLFVPLSLATGLGLMLWMFRRWLAVAATLAVISASLGSGLAVTAATGHAFTMASAILIPLVIALTVALLVHLCNALTRQAQLGHTGRERIARAHTAIRRPALFTALTTAAAFLSLSISPQPAGVFGQSAAAAVLVQYVAVLWVLPAIFARWDRRSWPLSTQGVSLLERPICRLMLWAYHHPRTTLAAALIVVVIGTPHIFRIEADADLLRFLPDEHPTVAATEQFAEHFHGTSVVDIVFIGDGRDTFVEPDQLERIAAMRDWLEARPEVDRTRSMLDTLEELHWALHNEDPDYRTLPDSRALISQYLLLYDGADLYDRVDRNFQIARISVSLKIRGSQAINRFAAEIEETLAAQGWQPDQTQLAGTAYLLSQNQHRIMRGQLYGLLLASALIFLLMALLWRSFQRAAIGMLPNLFPVFCVVVILGLGGLSLNVVTAMIAAIVLGIAVDDTIHLYYGYLNRRSAGFGHGRALLHTYRRAGRAVTATTVILGAQMLWLTFSGFTPTSTFGLLTAAGIGAAWLFDLLVLPAILTLLHQRRNHHGHRSHPSATGS
ncbi:hypothetical protein CKO15_06760 [Halorhodospira abdelmalekii]|uniref:efflux RND transporter permease subunit n=1 Tax=Halorhodospira abdelmalekii TaxID=421629 RepID=UPI00190761C6|nr:MMPL family transporter [Halorhodospira abdelmalekii]MBK1734988.1 hypothetical protein [Halorhodospira abdelmalekii]